MSQRLIFNNIERYRKLRNIPKMDFYAKIGMSDVGYSKMVKNETMRLSTLFVIADVLNVSLNDLMSLSAPDTIISGKSSTDTGQVLYGKRGSTDVQFEIDYLVKRVELLKEELEAKNKIIAQQKKLIDAYDDHFGKIELK